MSFSGTVPCTPVIRGVFPVSLVTSGVSYVCPGHSRRRPFTRTRATRGAFSVSPRHIWGQFRVPWSLVGPVTHEGHSPVPLSPLRLIPCPAWGRPRTLWSGSGGRSRVPVSRVGSVRCPHPGPAPRPSPSRFRPVSVSFRGRGGAAQRSVRGVPCPAGWGGPAGGAWGPHGAGEIRGHGRGQPRGWGGPACDYSGVPPRGRGDGEPLVREVRGARTFGGGELGSRVVARGVLGPGGVTAG